MFALICPWIKVRTSNSKQSKHKTLLLTLVTSIITTVFITAHLAGYTSSSIWLSLPLFLESFTGGVVYTHLMNLSQKTEHIEVQRNIAETDVLKYLRLFHNYTKDYEDLTFDEFLDRVDEEKMNFLLTSEDRERYL